MRSGVALCLLGLAAVAIGSPQGYGDDDDSSVSTSVTTTATSTSATTTSTSTSTSTSSLLGMQGDVTCSSYMCIGGLINGSTIQYTMQSLRSNVGWLAMGFGTQMSGAPMIIMWSNSDGTVTVSQRQASGHNTPSVVSSPPRTATVQQSLSVLSGSNPKFVYTLPYEGETTQNVIWAFGSVNPGSTSQSASILQHLDAGSRRLSLGTTLTASSKDPTNPISNIGSGSSSGSGSGSSGNSTDSQPSTGGDSSVPLKSYEKFIIAHAILCVIGFLGLLPLGALVARFFRTFTNSWFKAHWIIQFGLALPIIVTGVALGIYAVSDHGTEQLGDTHKKWGVAIFALYFTQVFLGALIHYIKPKSFTMDRKRPIQNYLHAILGLAIIGLAFYQVHDGYDEEWPMMTGRGDVGKAADIVFYIWVVVIPLAYIGGLYFLRRQFRQEKTPPSAMLMSTTTLNKPVNTYNERI